MAIINTYPPVGRKGLYSYETVEVAGTRYTWKPNQDRWEASGGTVYNQIIQATGIGAPDPNSRERLASGEFVGGFYNNNKKGATIPITGAGDIITYPTSQLIIKTNTKKGRLFVNGVDSGNANQVLQINKQDILRTGEKRIKVTQDGYTSNEEYVVSSETILGKPNYNPGYLTTDVNRSLSILGVTGVQLVVKKYVNGQIVSYNGQNGSAFSIDFTLTKKPLDVKPILDNTLTINVSGPSDSVILLKNNRDEIELEKGRNIFTDVKGTKFQFRALDGYQIIDLDIREAGKKRGKLFNIGRRNTTPNTLITLDSDIELWVTVKSSQIAPTPPPPVRPPVVPTSPVPIPIVPSGPEPKISLFNSDVRQHDIKDKSGIPISFKKNSAVRAVTAFVGTKHYVFDDLGSGGVAGIVIPSSAFKQVGRIEVKLIPYDLDELDDTIEQITRSSVTRTREVVEERIVEVQRPVPTPIEVEDTIIIPKGDKPKPKPKPKPIPPKDPPKPAVFYTGGTGGGGRGGGASGEGEFISDFNEGRRIPSPYDAGGGFDNADGTRVRRAQREL